MATPPTDFDDALTLFVGAVHLQSGGQKAVYRYRHDGFGEVVLKFCNVGSSDELARIEREVSLLKDIDSEFYPRHYEFRKIDSTRFLIIEEYLPGVSLIDALPQFKEPAKALNLASEIVTALEMLWRRKVVHRDLKPGNVIVSGDGHPRIIDLGIARLIGGTSLTNTMAYMGPCTPYFAAPEQLTNSKAEIDFRADQFALGILLFLMVTGEHPFDPNLLGSGGSIVDNILKGVFAVHLVEGNDLKPMLPLIQKLLGKEPYQRFRTVPMLHAELAKTLSSYQ